MCQVKSKRVHRKKVVGYRVYNVKASGLIRSYYKDNPKVDIGLRVEKNTDEPFHAFSSKVSLFNWIEIRSKGWVDIEVYKCELEGGLQRGIWHNWLGDYSNITTVTGDVCTLVEKMNLYDLRLEKDKRNHFKQLRMQSNREGLVFKSTITSTYGSYTKDAYKVKHWEPTSKI